MASKLQRHRAAGRVACHRERSDRPPRPRPTPEEPSHRRKLGLPCVVLKQAWRPLHGILTRSQRHRASTILPDGRRNPLMWRPRTRMKTALMLAVLWPLVTRRMTPRMKNARMMTTKKLAVPPEPCSRCTPKETTILTLSPRNTQSSSQGDGLAKVRAGLEASLQGQRSRQECLAPRPLGLEMRRCGLPPHE
jgi:hypothetical protein